MEHLNHFLTYLAAEKGLSRNTIQSYQFDLRKFQSFLASKNKDLVSFSRADIIDFIESLRDSGSSIPSICRAISSIKGLCRYLIIEKEIKGDPSENLQTPKRWERLPKALSIAEITSLLEESGKNGNCRPSYDEKLGDARTPLFFGIARQ